MNNNTIQSLKRAIPAVEELVRVSDGVFREKSEEFLDFIAEKYLSLLINGSLLAKDKAD